MITKNFVTFLSPGTFFSEQNTMEIDDWNVEKAVEMSRGIRERYGATPYGFFFTQRGRKDDELDSKVIATSNLYYLGGQVFTYEEIKAQNNHENAILIRNMEYNDYKKCIVNTNSWKFTAGLRDTDVILDYTP